MFQKGKNGNKRKKILWCLKISSKMYVDFILCIEAASGGVL